MSWFTHLLFLLVIFLTVFMEATFDGFRHLVGTQVDFLPALMVYAGLTYSIGLIAGAAVWGSLCFDALSANPLGTSLLPLMVVGVSVHVFRSLLLRELIYAQFVIGTAACASAPLLTLFILSGLEHEPSTGLGFLWQWLVMSIVGGLSTPLIFLVLDRLAQTLNYQPESESSFRPDRQIKRGRQ